MDRHLYLAKTAGRGPKEEMVEVLLVKFAHGPEGRHHRDNSLMAEDLIAKIN